MNLTTRDRNLLVFVICVAIIAVAYIFGYSKLSDKNTALDEEIKVLQADYKTKKDTFERKDIYIKKSDENDALFQELLTKYPEGIEQENQIMFIRDLEDNLSLFVSSLSMSSPNSVYGFPAANAYTTENYTGISSELNFPFSATYEQFENLLKYIALFEDRKVFKSLSVTYNSGTDANGAAVADDDVLPISGSVIINEYAVTSTLRKLLDPEILKDGKPIPTGGDNIFVSSENIGGLKTTEEIVLRIKNTYDAYVMLSSKENSFDSVIMGMRGDNDTITRTNSNISENITITVDKDTTGTAYMIKFEIGQKGEAGYVTSKQTVFYPGEFFDLYVQSSERDTPTDLAGVTAKIVNNTDLKLNVTVGNDDPKNPRWLLPGSNITGDVAIYELPATK